MCRAKPSEIPAQVEVPQPPMRQVFLPTKHGADFGTAKF